MGTRGVAEGRDGLVTGTEIDDGEQVLVRIENHPERLLIDYQVGPSADDLQPRIFVRITPGAVIGASGDCCLLTMTALRTDGMDDVRWKRLTTAHALEVELIKSTLETGFDSSDQLKVDKLWYSFPYGEDVNVTFGPLVGAEDMTAVNPSLYGSETILDVFTYAGSPGTYGRPLGGGCGVSWNAGEIDISTNYVSTNASNSNTESGGGIMNEAAGNR